MAKHINLLAGPFWWGALGPGLLPPPKSGAGKHIKATVPTDSHVMTKKKTFPLNHSLACASYAIYLDIANIHAWVKKAEKNRKSNDEKNG